MEFQENGLKRIEINKLNCSTEVANGLFDFFAQYGETGQLEELTISNLNPKIDQLDPDTVNKFAENCTNITKLKVKNLFMSSAQVRSTLAFLVRIVLDKSKNSLKYLSLHNFSGSKEVELGHEML